MQKIIAVFENRSRAMQFASLLKRVSISCRVIDTPRDLSSSCGISVVFDSRYLATAKNLIVRAGVVGGRFYMLTNDTFKKYKLINL